MDQQTLQLIVDEIQPLLVGKVLGKIFQLDAFSLAIDFGLRGRYLFLSLNPAAPRLYLIERRLKDLEKQSLPHGQFVQSLRAVLGRAHVTAFDKDQSERVLRIQLDTRDVTGESEEKTLVVQLTGRSANLFLLDAVEHIVLSLRTTKGAGQSPGEKYQPPRQGSMKVAEAEPPLPRVRESISTALDEYYQRIDREKAFESRARSLRGRMQRELNQKTKLRTNLETDLVAHGDPLKHKRLGDLLLANISTAKRRGPVVTISDYFTEGAPEIAVEIDENMSLQEAAAASFTRYAKARRASEEIKKRIEQIELELDELNKKIAGVDQALADHDEELLDRFEDKSQQRIAPRGKLKEPEKIPGVRRYRSTDGYEILVGRGARDNDHLTFRIAKPNDLWLHAADYPGSHVVVRKPDRRDIPHRTILEAAQLAARFSQASEDSKVVVHYTSRKFLAKPKGTAPGLVRMSTFKTLTVEPKEAVERI